MLYSFIKGCEIKKSALNFFFVSKQGFPICIFIANYLDIPYSCENYCVLGK